jgi:hypothetical protein
MMGTAEKTDKQRYWVDLETQFADPQLNHQLQTIIDRLNSFIGNVVDDAGAVASLVGRSYSAVLQETSDLAGYTEAADWNNGSLFDLTLTEDRTLQNPINFPDGRPFIVRVRQGNPSKACALGFSLKFRGGDQISLGAVVLSTDFLAEDYLGFLYNAVIDTYDLLMVFTGYKVP